jgi:hypothetical protein
VPDRFDSGVDHTEKAVRGGHGGTCAVNVLDYDPLERLAKARFQSPRTG